jgi:rhodanese-related sulfurtransferase
MEAHRISPAEVKQRLDLGYRIVFIDTRSPASWDGSDGMLPGALRIPADEIPDHLDELPHDGTIVIYAADENEGSSAHAAVILTQAGFRNVFALTGGFDEWHRAGLPIAHKREEQIGV